MKQEIQQIFKLFKGDFQAMSIFVYLASSLNANQLQLISLSELSTISGYSRNTLPKILSRLIKMGLIETFSRPKKGVEVSIVAQNSATVAQNCARACSELIIVAQNSATVAQNCASLTNPSSRISSEVSEEDSQKFKVFSDDLNLKSRTLTKLKTKFKSPKKPSTKDPRISEIKAAWNELAKEYGLPTVRVIDAKRITSLKERLGEIPEVADWVEAIGHIPNSKFLLGFNDRNWKANFDWLLRPSNVAKLLEGQWDSKKPNVDLEKQIKDKEYRDGNDKKYLDMF